MNKKNSFLKKICGYLLTIMMTLSFFVNCAVYADDATQQNNTFVGNGFEVTFDIVSKWEGAFNGTITIKNTSDKPIENWSMKFSMDEEMTSIWNANVLDKNGSDYIVMNSGWNQDIQPGASVSFGFSANYSDNIEIPQEYSMWGAEVKVPDDLYTINSKVTGQWDGAYTGEVTITNVSDEPIEDWECYFDMDDEIQQIWNAEKVSVDNTKNHIKNCGYNGDIQPGQSVTFGFQASITGTEISEMKNLLVVNYNPGANPQSEYEVDLDDDGLPDYYENMYGKDPYLADSNGDGIKDGEDKYPVTVSSDNNANNEPSNVSAAVDVNADGKQLNTLEIAQVPKNDVMLSSNIPGYVGNAYEFKIDGSFDNAKISFTIKSEPTSNYKPSIYCFNEEKQWLQKVPNQTIEGNTLSASVNKAGKYIVLNELEFNKVWEEQIRLPSEEKGFDRIDLVLVIDASWTMKQNDPSNVRLQVAKSMVDQLKGDDRVAVIDFGVSANLLTSFTTDKNLAKSKISRIGNDGSTALNQAVALANSEFTSRSTEKGAYKMMVVLTDGLNNVPGPTPQQLAQTSLDNDIVIYTVGLGSSLDASSLTYMASTTNGGYYNAAHVSGLSDIFNNITQESIDYTTDSDGDGISDYFEDRLHRLFNGIQVQLDKNNPDTDGDGIPDGQEVTVSVADGDIVYLKMTSDPTKRDTDGDGVDDNLDSAPLLPNVQ